MSKCNCYVTGNTRERKEFFKAVCTNGQIPVICPIPLGRFNHKDLKEPQAFTKVALDRLSADETERLVKVMMKKFSLPKVIVEHDLETKGCPIRLDLSVNTVWCSLHSRMVMM